MNNKLDSNMNKKSSQIEQNQSDDFKERHEGGGTNSGDFVNIWEEKDFLNQSDAQKTKSLTYVVN